jgi:hypothetical protein
MTRRIPLGAALLVLGSILLPAAPAAADDNNVTFRGASADGQHVFFTTEEKMVPEDTDTAVDVYDRFGNATTLISAGAINGNTNGQTAFFEANSEDGSRVLFRTFEPLVVGDTDDDIDLYQRTGGVTTQLSAGAINGNGDFDVSFGGSNPAANAVFFETGEPLVAADTDSSTDVYQRTGSTTTLVSAGAINGNGAFNAFFRGVSDLGTRVFFTTSEPLVSADTDSSSDVYQRFASTTTLISAGAINGNGAFSANFQAASSDGTRVLFSSSEPLLSADTDTRLDVYQRSGSTTTLISAGAINGNGFFDALFRGASVDASRVFFTTAEPLVSVDTDASVDIYERSIGTTTRISGDPTGDNGAFDALFEGASDDGTIVLFTTREPMNTGDTDEAVDVYGHLEDGSVDGISAEHTAPDGTFDVTFGGNSPDGSQVYFTTQEALPGSTDEDESSDVYQFDFEFSFAFRVSGPAVNFEAGQAGFPATFVGASDDGSRVIFTTFERLSKEDVDGARDVYGTFVGSALLSREARPPDTTIGAGVPAGGFSKDTTPVFSFSSSEAGSTFQCRIVPASFTSCSSPEVFGPLADGSRTLEVKATDAAANQDPTPASRTFTVDTLPPDPSIDGGPEGVTNNPTPTFTFSADEAATFACRVDAAAFGECSDSSFHTTPSLADGVHTFKLRARDQAGNTAYTHQRYRVDTTPPNTVITSVVKNSAKKTATVNFTGTDTPPESLPLHFLCKLDAGASTQCANGKKVYKQLAVGAHTVTVTAIDAADNTDPSPATRNFTI